MKHIQPYLFELLLTHLRELWKTGDYALMGERRKKFIRLIRLMKGRKP